MLVELVVVFGDDEDEEMVEKEVKDLKILLI